MDSAPAYAGAGSLRRNDEGGGWFSTLVTPVPPSNCGCWGMDSAPAPRLREDRLRRGRLSGAE